MERLRLLTAAGTALLLSANAFAQEVPYSVQTHGDIVQLRDANTDTVVSVLTPVSNAYEMVVKGQDILRMRFKSVDELRARPALNGIPLLAPFANRLDETAFYANDRKYNFDVEMGNIRSPIPIHGYLTGASQWQVMDTGADASGAWVTSRLEFYRIPEYMQQFPFAHTLTMTYKLADGALEVRTRIDNLSVEPMPVAIGFHPYFQLTDSVRDEWVVSAPADTYWILDSDKLPTGETQPAEEFWGRDPSRIELSDFSSQGIDAVFSDLERDESGRATFSFQGPSQKVAVTVGPKYRTLLVYSQATAQDPSRSGSQRRSDPQDLPPPVSTGPDVPLSANADEDAPANRGFVAFEPMAGITNSMNLTHRELYDELQSVAPGKSWEESFWVRPSGY